MKPAQTTAKNTGWKKLTNRTPNVLQAVVSKMEQHSKKNDGRSMPEDFRTRRRRLYRLHSEKRPEFPFQQRNFYTHVMDNKDIIKTLSLLSTCMQELKPVRHYQLLIIIRCLSYNFKYEFDILKDLMYYRKWYHL